jgi:hypothetical protein
VGKTIRCYNKPKWIKRMGYGHPWKQLCMGRCRACRKIEAKDKDWKYKRKRLKRMVLREVVLCQCFVQENMMS